MRGKRKNIFQMNCFLVGKIGPMAFLGIIPARQMMETKKLIRQQESLKVVQHKKLLTRLQGVRYFIAGGIPELYPPAGVWMFLPEGKRKQNTSLYTQDGQIKIKCWCMYSRGIQS
jgi:hypothetical protein